MDLHLIKPPARKQLVCDVKQKQKNGASMFGVQSTFWWYRHARVLMFGLRSLRVLPMLIQPNIFLFREMLPI